ncbi:hypothetical protein P4358_26720 [Bacillus thuringiensis]|nr:hypothetical protein [Bacillus thuringiensis]
MKSKEKPTQEQYELAERNGISRNVVNQRIKLGEKTVEEAITKPLHGEFKRKYKKYIELAQLNGISYKAFYARIKLSKRHVWTPYEAATITTKKYSVRDKDEQPNPTIRDYEKAERIGVSKKNVDQRIDSGWSVERAITTPVGTSWEGNEKNTKLIRLAEKNGISESTFYRRKRNGMTPYDAATKPKGFEEYIILAESNGISNKAFYQRVKRNMDPYEAATKPPRKYKKKQIS